MNNIGSIIETAATMAGIVDPSQGLGGKQKLMGLDALNSLLAGVVAGGNPIYHNELISFNTVVNKNPLVMSSDPTINPDILTTMPVLKLSKCWYRIYQD